MTNNDVEKRLWKPADQLRANSKLKASEYSMPVLGLIFLRYADSRFSAMRKLLQAERAEAAGITSGRGVGQRACCIVGARPSWCSCRV